MSSRQKVAIIYPFFAHYRAPVIQELMRNGAHDYYLLGDAADPSGSIKTMTLAGEPRFVPTRSQQLPAGLVWQHGLLSAALRDAYDCYIFLGNASWPATWLAAISARLRGRRVLFWTHGWTRPDHGLKRILRGTFYRLSHSLLLYGHYARDIGLRAGFSPARLHVIYNSLDFELQQRLINVITDDDKCHTRKQLFGSAAPVVIASARLTRIKRFDVLIRALGRVNQTRTVNLLLVGDGPEREALTALARQENVNAVFAGACYDERRLAELFSIANVTVSPGNVGLTCMHSLAYGVPVVTHDDPEDQMPEWEAIEPGVTGSLFRKDAVESLAAEIDRWTRTSLVEAPVSERCIESIRSRYHPAVQRMLIEAAIDARP